MKASPSSKHLGQSVSLALLLVLMSASVVVLMTLQSVPVP